MRKLAIEAATLHGATHHEVVAAPTVIAAVAVGGEGAAEIAGREGGYLLRHPKLGHGRLESHEGTGELLHQSGVGRDEEVVQIETAQ